MIFTICVTLSIGKIDGLEFYKSGGDFNVSEFYFNSTYLVYFSWTNPYQIRKVHQIHTYELHYIINKRYSK
jgi:hypothetical protein